MNINNASREVKSSYENLSKSKFIRTELNKSKIEISSYKKQIEKLRGGLKGISEDDKKIIDRAKFYVNEKNIFDEVRLEYSTIAENIQTLKGTIEKYITQIQTENQEFENKSIIDGLDKERNRFLSELSTKLDSIVNIHSTSEKTTKGIHQDWIIVTHIERVEILKKNIRFFALF